MKKKLQDFWTPYFKEAEDLVRELESGGWEANALIARELLARARDFIFGAEQCLQSIRNLDLPNFNGLRQIGVVDKPIPPKNREIELSQVEKIEQVAIKCLKVLQQFPEATFTTKSLWENHFTSDEAICGIAQAFNRQKPRLVISKALNKLVDQGKILKTMAARGRLGAEFQIRTQ